MCAICESIREAEDQMDVVTDGLTLPYDQAINAEILLLDKLKGLYAERDVQHSRGDWDLAHPE